MEQQHGSRRRRQEDAVAETGECVDEQFRDENCSASGAVMKVVTMVRC
jgi:hypothetical protein